MTQRHDLPSKEEIVTTFFRTYEAAFATLRSCDDALLLAPTPVDSPLRNLCPTLGSMLAFYAIGHVTSHLGKLALGGAWKVCLRSDERLKDKNSSGVKDRLKSW